MPFSILMVHFLTKALYWLRAKNERPRIQMEIALFVSGLVAGVINSLAGGGSFITFPMLVFAGLPPVVGNATNTFASCSGYLAGLYSLRKELVLGTSSLVQIIILSGFGGWAGAELLLIITPDQFAIIVPWLMLLAAVLFTFSGKVNRFFVRLGRSRSPQAKTIVRDPARGVISKLGTFAIALYGGFFNAGQGIMLIALYAVVGIESIHRINAIKLLVSSTAAIVAIMRFMLNGYVHFYWGVFVLVGTVIGGYLAAHYGRLLPEKLIRGGVIVISFTTTAYFFIRLL